MRPTGLTSQAALALAIYLSGPGTAIAQVDNWPCKSVTMINAFLPGGGTTIESRLYGLKLQENTGKTVVQDFKPGAGTMLGTGYVVNAAPDGCTLLVATPALTIAPLVYDNLRFDPIKDLAYLSMMSKRATMLAANPKTPFNTGAEYIAYAKANPGKINFGTSGQAGSAHLSMQPLHQITGTTATFVHYKGGSTLFTALMSREVDVTMGSAASFMPLFKAGKIKSLGLTSLQRHPVLPDMPTISESIKASWEYAPFLGFATSAKTPVATLERINAELVKVSKVPSLAEKLEGDLIIMVGSSRQEFTSFVTAEAARWRKVVADANIKLGEE